ncbi:MAG: F0F1 ATP synthase subunit epsilon [Syntrophobacteraceae bacterium]
MRLKVMLPMEILIDEQVAKITAEAENGSFCLLPRHIDFTAALVPGLLFYESTGGEEIFLAIDEGILVKCGADVLVSTRNAARGPDLGMLRKTIDEQYLSLNKRQKMVRSSIARLESDMVRRFMELK